MTMSPHCDDELKYEVLERIVAEYQALADAGGSIMGRKIVEAITVNGVRVHLEDGSWVLVRASSNKPELVVVVESMHSDADMRALFARPVRPQETENLALLNLQRQVSDGYLLAKLFA